jgi:O-antigen ligase
MQLQTRHGTAGFWAGVVWVIGVGSLALLLGRASAVQPFVAAALLLVLAVGWLVAIRRLTALVPLATLTLAWGTSTLPFVSLSFPAKFAMLGAIAATMVPWLLSGDRHLPVSMPFTIAFGALVLFATMSVAWSVDADESLQKAISLALLGAATLIAIPLNCRDEQDARAILTWNGIAAAAFTLAGLVTGLVGIVSAFEGNGRFLGFLNNPNALGFWIAPILPVLVVMATQETPGTRRRLLVSSTVVLAATLAISGSRAGTIASVAGVLAAFLASGFTGQGRTVKRTVIIGIVAFAAAASIFPALGLTLRAQTSGNVEGFFELGSGSGRAVVWGEALPLINGAPVLGHGFGTTPELFPSVQQQIGTNVLGRTHNSYLEAAVDLGWPGFVLLISLVVSGFVAAWGIVRRPGPHRPFATVLLAGIVGGAVEGLFESGLLAAGSLLALPFWIVVALAHSVRAADRRGLHITAS